MTRDDFNNIINANLPDNTLREISPEKARTAMGAAADYAEDVAGKKVCIEITVPSAGQTVSETELKGKNIAYITRNGGTLMRNSFIKPQESSVITLLGDNEFGANELIVVTFLG